MSVSIDNDIRPAPAPNQVGSNDEQSHSCMESCLRVSSLVCGFIECLCTLDQEKPPASQLGKVVILIPRNDQKFFGSIRNPF